MQFHLKDKYFHFILFGLIALFASISIYYKYLAPLPDPIEKDFSSYISKYDLELGLQNKAEKIKPNSLKVPILIYHSVRPHIVGEDNLLKYYTVSPESFEAQMQYLKDHNYSVLSLDFVLDALEQNINLPEKSVVLTFDDGWRNQYVYAYPILKKFAYTATFFIFTNAIDSPHFLSWDQVRVLNNSGMNIGGHTLSHPYLMNITDTDMLRKEIITSKKIIEDQLGMKINTFAYPFGHYNDQIISVVKEAGYRLARSTYSGIYNSKADLFTMKGIEATDDLDRLVRDMNK